MLPLLCIFVFFCYCLFLECSTDEDCSLGYFCGSPLPQHGSNYYDHPSTTILKETTFLQQNIMQFDGESVVALPVTLHPQLSSDISIVATVCQDSGNDGYIVGKGANDRIRDFGLYLRSSKKSIWLAYGADSSGESFREILIFNNVLIADGKCHSVSAVIDSSINRAILYIDGEANESKPLPSTPEFRPGV